MDTLPGPSTRGEDPDVALPTALREGGPVARRIPSLAAWLRRLWARYVPEAEDRPGWGDLWAVLLLFGATYHLVGHDGGRPSDASMLQEGLLQQLAGIAPVLVLAVPVLLTSIGEVSRDGRLTRWLLLAWSAGPLIALVAAGIRDGWVRSLATIALAVPVFLAARRVWRARWGPLVLGVLVVIAGFRAWGYGLLLWMSSSSVRHWPLLSWHNQTATLMGLVFLVGLAIAWTSRRWVRAVGVVLAVCGGSGLWLAASRGAFVLTLLGLAVALALALRSPYARSAVALTVLAVVLVVPTVVVVSDMRVQTPTASVEGSEAEPDDAPRSERALLDRGTDVANLTMRFDYWSGTLAMFRSSPLTGTGPGSFPTAAPPHLRPDYFPTLSAHNEYLEVLGGMGLAGAIPVWGATLGIAWLALGVIRRPGMPSHAASRDEETALSPERWAGRIAAVGGLTLLGTHAGMDLDWLWPLLLGCAAIAAGILHADVVPLRSSPAPRRVAAVPIVAALVLSVVTATGVVVQRTGPAPWDQALATQQIVRAVEQGNAEDARPWLEATQRWNPGSHDTAMTTALVAYVDGEMSAQEVAASIHPRGVRFPVQIQVASVLLDAGQADAAEQVLTSLRPHLAASTRAHGGWQSSYVLELAVASHRGGCEAARNLWEMELRARADGDGLDVNQVAQAWTQGRGSGCPIR